MRSVDTLEWLILTRHGESTGNVAYRTAMGTDAEELGLRERDSDIPLSDTGREQAALLGGWLAGLPEDERPTVAVSSPYLRSLNTARLALAEAPYGVDLRVDERLRDRELGVLEGLTPRGVGLRFPEEAVRMRRLGKFYYRPPGGESWCDLALRLRSFYRDLAQDHPGGRPFVIAHDAIVVMTRYVVEGLGEREILDIEKDPVLNCSVTRWRSNGGKLSAVTYNACDHLPAIP
ncbi:histidine phosphatase family protein [Spirillospora sp. NPDC047279]|uniref:histidine phosphatase family protein n=1 Tax=Spirillospora sp. NPDC047279 TaxID=3155478 RepID=UPI0033E058EE